MLATRFPWKKNIFTAFSSSPLRSCRRKVHSCPSHLSNGMEDADERRKRLKILREEASLVTAGGVQGM